MAEKKKSESFWVLIFKLIFSTILLLSVASGTFLLGTKTLTAKMQAEQTISMEAEGDPSTFNMSLQVLRPESGSMIELIQYSLPGTATVDE